MASVQKKEYDVFLVYRSEDNKLADTLTSGVKEHGLTVYTDFIPGRSILDNIVYGLEHSQTVLIVLTQHLLDSDWVKFELKVALDKSVSENAMCLRIVCDGISDEDRKGFMTGTVLEKIPAINLDFNRESWSEELVKHIKDEMPMSELLPGGNVSLGLVFNYFNGFLSHVLPGLEKATKASEYYKNSPKATLTKLIILSPNSCDVKPIEGSYENGKFVITKMAKSLSITESHGDKIRDYSLNVYSVLKEGCQPFYFVADSPFILKTMYTMKKQKFVDIDIPFQVAAFRKHLIDFVEHKDNLKFNGTACFVECDDVDKLAADIWKELETQLSSSVDETMQTETIKTKQGRRDTMEVTVLNADYTEDNELAHEVQNHLEKNNVKFNGFERRGPAMYDVDWLIFIFSDKAVHDEALVQSYDMAISNCVTLNEIKVIPILRRGTVVETLPRKIRWTLLLKQEDDDYLDKMMKMMDGGKQQMTGTLTAGNVYEGLAYAYLFNYLPFTFGSTETGRDFRGRFVDAKEKYNIQCPCVPRVIVIIPRSCKFPAPGSVEQEEHLGPIEPVKIGSRPYGLHMYRLTLSSGEKVCYAREYATPTISMYEMANKYPFAGLGKEEMYEQAEKFSSFCQTITDNPGYKDQYGDITDKCTFLYVDDVTDQEMTVHKKLEETLLQCLENSEVL